MKLKIWQTLLIVLVVCVFSALGFTGCGSSRDGMSLNIESSSITTDTSGRKVIQLVKSYDDETGELEESAYASISVKVENGDSSITRTVSAISSSNSQVSASVQYNTETQINIITLTAISPTASATSTYITITSNEDSTKKERIYVQVLEKATGMTYSDESNVTPKSSTLADPDIINGFAIFKGESFVFDTEALFAFEPEQCYVPKIVYATSMSGNYVYQDGEALITSVGMTATEVIVTCYDFDDPTNATFKKVFKLYVYNAINADDFSLNRTNLTSAVPVTEFDLINNCGTDSPELNQATLEIDSEIYASGLTYAYTLSDPTAEGSILLIDQSSTELNKFYLTGVGKSIDGITITFSISYGDIENSPVVTKSVLVRVVNYPTAVEINDTSQTYSLVASIPTTQEGYYGYYFRSGTSTYTYTLISADNFADLEIVAGTTACYQADDYDLVVFDNYDDVAGATLLVVLEGVEYPALYGQYTLEIDTTNALNLENLATHLIIKKSNGTTYSFAQSDGSGGYTYPPLTFTSGDSLTLYVSDGIETGSLPIIIKALKNIDEENPLTRNMTLNFTAGITELNVETGILATDSKLLMEYSESGVENENAERKVYLDVTPVGAEIAELSDGTTGCYISAVSKNASVATVSQVYPSVDNGDGTYTKAYLIVTAQGVGSTLITLTTANGLKLTFTAVVTALLNTVTLSLASSSYATTVSFSEKDDAVNDEYKTIDTITVDAGRTVTLDYNIYPSSAYLTSVAFTAGELNGTEISDTGQALTSSSFAKVQDTNKKSAWLQAQKQGTQYVVMTANYKSLNEGMTALEDKQIVVTFIVVVYQPITSVTVSTDSIQLLEGSSTGYYNKQQQTEDISITVNPEGSTVKNTDAVWTIKTDGTGYLTIAPTEASGGDQDGLDVIGSSITIQTKAFTAQETSKTVYILVTVTDVNGKEWTITISVKIVKQDKVGTVTAGSYDEDEGYYFEETSGVSELPTVGGSVVDRLAIINSTTETNDTISQYQTINTSIQYIDPPTNTNLEYFLFDATVSGTDWAVDGERIYDYSSSSIWLGYDESSDKYFITPLSSGYTIIYIIPQDRLSVSASSITDASDLPSGVGKVLHVTVADGYVTYYRLYDADDVARVSNNSSVWDRNYYIMNDIDMSGYCSANYWTPIGNSTTKWTGTMTSFNEAQYTLYGIDLTMRDTIADTTNGNFGSYYGFFGVVGTGTSLYKGSYVDCIGTIKNVNFELITLSITGTITTSAPSYIGTLAGRVASEAIINNVAVLSDNVTINVQASESKTLYIGTIAQNESGTTETEYNIVDLSTQFDFEILSGNSASAIIIFGGAIANNTATLQGGIIATTTVVTNNSACANATSIFGGAIGTTTSTVSNVETAGSLLISASIKASAVGGVVGTSTATLSNCVSSTRAGSAYNVGGIVGIISNGASVTNCHYEIYERTNDSDSALFSSINESTVNVGGIVGTGVNTTLSYCYVLSFASSQLRDITSTSVAGGLIGRINDTSGAGANISNCFFNASIYAGEIAEVGGLVGFISDTATVSITNSYVAGTITSSATYNGLFVGLNNATLGITTSYSVASTSEEFATVGSGSGSFGLTNVYVLNYVGGIYNETGVTYRTSTEMQPQSTFTNFDFTNYWIMPANTQINNGYPILRYGTGTLYPIIPTNLEFSAKSGTSAEENVYNTSDSRHIIIKLNGLDSSTFSLLDLFNISVSPTQEVEGLKISVISSNNSVINVVYGTTLAGFKIKVVGVGTATLIITSLYNSSVYEVIGITVVNGYADVKLYLSEEDKELDDAQANESEQLVYDVRTTEPLTDVTLQVNYSQEWFIDYDADVVAGSIGGGVAFIAPDGYFTVGINSLASTTLSTQSLIEKCLAIGYIDGAYDLDTIQQAFQILFSDNSATVEYDGTYYIFTTGTTEITAKASYYSGPTTNRTITRSQIINLCNIIAFDGVDLSSTLFASISEATMTDCLARAGEILALFYSNSSVSFESIQTVNYILYTVNGYAYARTSQVGTSSYTLYNEVYMYVENANYATVTALPSNTAGLTVYAVPYLKGVFNTTTGKVVNTTTETELSFIWDDAVCFNLIIYNGAKSLFTSIGGTLNNPTELEISQDIEMAITLDSDSPLDQTNGVVVSIFAQAEDESWTKIASRGVNEDTGLWETTENYDNIYKFSLSAPSISSGQISQTLLFGVLDSYKSQFNTETIYKIVLSNYQFVEGSTLITKTVYFKFTPQGISYIDVTHYADAELEGDSGTTAGNYLTNAGAEPTDTILAGEMGLMRINLYPYYAQFDTITITSNTVSGDLVSLQQRVAQTISISGVNQTRYYFYETGVSYLSNGIIVAPVSNYNGTFDGTIWLQTLIAKQTTSASSFILTITISREGYDDYVYSYTLSVDISSNIVLSYDGTLNADSLSPQAYVAVGTGGSEQALAVNQNILTVTTTGSFESVSAPVIQDDTTGGLVSISSANDKYYIVVKATFTLNGNTYTISGSNILLGTTTVATISNKTFTLNSNTYTISGNNILLGTTTVATISSILGTTFTVKVQGIKYVNGYRRTITRYMYFTVTDFVLKNNSITITGVSSNKFDEAYYQDANYKLQIGYNEENINADLSISSVQTALNNFIEDLNDGTINVWSVVEGSSYTTILPAGANSSGATYVYANTTYLADTVSQKTSTTASDATNVYSAINSDYYIRLVTGDGWYICPLRQSTGNILNFTDISYIFSAGSMTTTLGSATSYFTVLGQDITLSFTQQTSLDNPIPIYTLEELLGMEEDKDYRLMADIDTSEPLSDEDIDTTWTPLSTAISSLDGNGHTITITGFNNSTVGTASTPANYGFFSEVDEDTILKNLTIQYAFTSNTYTLNLSASVSANFGGIAGTNNGILANCVVQGYSSGSISALTITSTGALTDVFNIGGFVGVNNGSISNSRVTYLQLSGKGTVAGFVARNYLDIASSYVDYGSIINTSTSNTVGATAGFVGYNGNKGSVCTSYVGSTYVEEAEGEYSISTSVGVRGRTEQITSTVNTGGFIYSNIGSVTDSFSGISLSVDTTEQLGSRSGGFVFSNGTGGTIARCYSVSYTSSSNKAHTPFVGPNETYSGLNNNDADAITSCFYYDSVFGQWGIDETTKLGGIEGLTLERFVNADNQQISFWQDYSTSRSYAEGSVSDEEWTSVWTFLDDDNVYFNIDNFYPATQTEGITYSVMGPRLVSADTLAMENWESVTYDTATESYTYGRGDVNYYLTLNESEDGYVVSPYLIDSAETLYIDMMSEIDGTGVIYGWYRLISDIDLSDLITLGYDLTEINQATFCGNFEGNGFTIQNLDIASSSVTDFGLFGKITNANIHANNYASVQNLSIEVNDIAAALVSRVGTLAGSADSVVLSNIDVYSNSSALIIGKNMVGGIVGKLSGSSRVSNLSSSISVSAVYGNTNTNTLIYNSDLWRLYESDGLVTTNETTTLTNSDSVLCYAGGVFGVADLEPFVEGNLSITEEEYNEARISNLLVTDESKAIGTTVGGVIGLLGASTYATDIKKEVQSGAYLKGSRYAGGIVGENHGYLNYARLEYTADIQTVVDSSIYIGALPTSANFSFFQGTSKAIGGVVGLNLGLLYAIQTGVVENSYNKVNVVNKSAQIAGGLIGVSTGGELYDCFVTGSVLSTRSGITGGAIGTVGSLSDISLDVQDPFINVSNKTSYVGMGSTEQVTIVNYVVAKNNWTYSDYASLVNIVSGGYLGGFIGCIYNNKISEDHTSKTNLEYNTLVAEGNGIASSDENNFYVSTIYSTQPSEKVDSSTGSLVKTVISAVGTGSSDDVVAKGLSRYEMYTYSYEATKSNSDINKQVDRMFENWAVYDYGTIIDIESNTFKIVNYGTDRTPVYNPQPNPTEIEIWNIEDFNNISDALSANYILMADLDFTDEEFVPIGIASRPFTGTFTGTSYNAETDTSVTHVISNITVDTNTAYKTSAIGLFAYTDGATISDLVMVGISLSWEPSLVSAYSYASLLVGSAVDTNISNVKILESYTRGTTTWTGTNKLSTSAKYVGGAIGNASLSVAKEINIDQVFVEADIEVKDIKDRELTIDENNEFTLEGVTYTIVGTTVQDVEGNVVANISSNTFTLNGFYCVKSSSTLTCSATQAPDVFVGGFVGYTSILSTRTMEISKSYFQGSISVDRQSVMTVGGFAGYSSNVTFNTVFADFTGTESQNYTFSNINFASSIGGFAGKVENSTIQYATVSGECSVGMVGNNKDFYIGGFAGQLNGTVYNSTTSLDINFTTSQNWTVQSSGSTTQMIGGFAGSFGTDIDTHVVLKNICSTATIRNSTLFNNTDGFAYETPNNFNVGNSNVANVYFDKYLSLSARDINNFGVTGLSLVQGIVNFTKLDSNDYSKLVTGSGLYPYVSSDNVSGDYYNKYYNLYVNTSSVTSNITWGSKLNPIKVVSLAVFNDIDDESDYYWYLQTASISDITLMPSGDFNGFYNGSGMTITTINYDSIYGSSITTQDMGIFRIIKAGSVVSGLEVEITARVGLNSDNDNNRTNIGVIASTVQAGGTIFGCYTSGGILIISSQQASNVIGGLVAVNSGQIIASSSVVDISINASAGKYFAVGGLVGFNANTVTTYAFKECYFTGSITNKITASGQTFVGGIVGKAVVDVSGNVDGSSVTNFVIMNVYSVAKIYGSGGLIVGACGTSPIVKNVYASAEIGDLSQSGSSIGSTFSILSQRMGTDNTTLNPSYNIVNGISYSESVSTSSMTSGAWASSAEYNYGLPYLKLQVGLKDTGSGTESNPYLINNEGQLAWALTTSAENGYYKLESDMDYTKLKNIITPSDVIFYGTLVGSGYYINNSTGCLVGVNSGTITQIGFTDATATTNLVAVTNNGSISEIYITQDGSSTLFASNGSGTVKNCLTNTYSINKNGEAESLGTINYADMFEISNYDFSNTWVLQITSAGTTSALTTGTLMLQAFVDNLGEIDVSGTTGSVTITTDTYNTYELTITTKEQYSALLQYIARSGINGETYIVTLGADIDMEGMVVPALLGEKEINLVFDGSGYTIYNLIINNQDTGSSASLFGNLTSSSSVTNLNLNQINLITVTNGGILADLNEGSITAISLTNSIITCAGAGESSTEYVGGVVGENSGTMEGVSVNTLTIISKSGYVGGVVGINYSTLTVGSVLYIAVNDTLNISAIGGVVGKSGDVDSEITVTGSIGLTTGDNSENIGGVVGYATQLGTVTATGDISLTIGANNSSIGGVVGNINSNTLVTINLASTINIVASSSNTNLGGIVGYAQNSGELIIYTSITLEDVVTNAIINITATDSSGVGGIIGNNEKSNVTIKQTSLATNFTNTIAITMNSDTGTNNNIGGIFGLNIADSLTINYAGGSSSGIAINVQAGDTNIGGVIGTNSKNITITSLSGISITGAGENVGGVVGTNSLTGAITVSSSGLISGITLEGASNIGGVAGVNSGTINKVMISDITITGDYNLGGLVGYNTDTVGKTGSGYETEITDIELTGNYNLGAVVGVNETDGVIQCITVKDDAGNVVVNYLDTPTEDSPVGFAMAYNNGTVSELNILISQTGSGLFITALSDAQNYIGIVTGTNTGTISDIVLENYTLVANSGSRYVGAIGANSGTIENISMTDVVVSGGIESIGGIIGYNMADGEASNLAVTYSSPTTIYLNDTANYVGGVIGYNAGTITGLSIKNNLILEGTQDSESNLIYTTNVGGAVGYNTGTIQSYFDTVEVVSYAVEVSNITVKGTNNIGGFVGYNTGIISRTSSETTFTVQTVTVIGTQYIGGFAGYNTGKITGLNDSNILDITSITVTGSTYVGGVAGSNDNNASMTDEGIYYVVVSDSNINSNYVDETESTYLGGIAGINHSTLSHITLSATNVKAQDGTDYGNMVGGIAGVNAGNINNTTVEQTIAKSIAGNNNVGGIAGSNVGSVSNVSISLTSEISSDVILGYGERVGGIVGQNAGTITNAELGAYVGVKGVGLIGGIAGSNTETIAGTITVDGNVGGQSNVGSYVLGGVAGMNTGTISATVTVGYLVSITGGILIGGLVGVNQGSGSISGASLTFEANPENALDLPTITYYGANVYTYDGSTHTNAYTDKNAQYWFNGVTIIEGDLYYIGVGRIIGANVNSASLCTYSGSITMTKSGGGHNISAETGDVGV